MSRRARRLRDTLHGPAYQRRLRNGWRLLLDWLSHSGRDAKSELRNSIAACECLCSFVQDLYERAPHRFLDARHVLLAVQTRFPAYRGHLRLAWDCLKSWSLERPVRNRRPMPESLLRALFVSALVRSVRSGSDMCSWIHLALLLRLGFQCLLRPAELFGLKVGDIRLPALLSSTGVVIIRSPKTRWHLGRIQHVLISDAGLISWLRWLLEGLSAHDSV